MARRTQTTNQSKRPSQKLQTCRPFLRWTRSRPARTSRASTASSSRARRVTHHRRFGAAAPTREPPQVTGGAGFIASHVVILLAKKRGPGVVAPRPVDARPLDAEPGRRYPQYKIVNFDRLDYCACIENLNEVAKLPNYKFVKGDICSADLVNFVLETEEVDTIMHFAAQTHVDNSFGNSFQFTRNNIMGTHVLLEAAKVHSIKRFVHVSTDEVYGEGENMETEPMIEDHVLEPTNPYAATKAAAEFLVKSYHRSFQLPIIITRGNNVYGPHQFPEKLIPKFVNQLARGRPVTLHGTGANTRNFLYVEDVARAFDCILHKAAVGKIYNIGGCNERSNLSVAKELIRIMGLSDNESSLITFVPDRAFNDLRYTIDNSELAKLGWKELMSWEEGLATTVEWYRKYSNRYKDIERALVAHPRIESAVSAI